MRRLVFLLASVAASLIVARHPSTAQLATAAGASAIFFPIVVADGSRDTAVLLANGSPQRVFVHCLYTPGGVGGEAQSMPFDLVLVARQPTHWRASTGRVVDPADPTCSRRMLDCDGAGLDPGTIPLLPDGFHGDLLCVQIDRSGAPVSGNALRGTATVLDGDRPDAARYAAVGLSGLPANDADETLCLGGDATAACPRGPEYSACPQRWLLEHRTEGAAPGGHVDAPGARTRLILSTCSRRAGTDSATVQLRVTNELEQNFSISVPVQRWAEIPLAGQNIFSRNLSAPTAAATSAHAFAPGHSRRATPWSRRGCATCREIPGRCARWSSASRQRRKESATTPSEAATLPLALGGLRIRLQTP